MSERTDRQVSLLQFLNDSDHPLSGQLLAQRLGVTRQVVVHEIALLRATGHRIFSTPKGYIVQAESQAPKHLLAVSHRPDQTERELTILVDCGIKVLDVRVEHQVYGEIIGNLFLSSRRDVEHFMQKIRHESAPLLSSLTDGVHYHLVEYNTEEQLQDAISQLQKANIQVL